mmetsp:Transcript_12947/g.25033  ORF Transcript_12947/g.25033 Transcript_12947/m.25033 type:complete len:976 (-) Transcript_12947:401-3328(-)
MIFYFVALFVVVHPAQWFEGPTTNRDAWIADLKQQRKDALDKISYKGGIFNDLQWTQTSYFQPQMHPYDRYFWDDTTNEYTVDRYLDDLETRYGGIDALLMWPTYPHLGIDDRNQFDMFRVMPGGLDGVRNITDQLHARGVRVLWPYNPWDYGTRRENSSDYEVLTSLLKYTNGDGANGDTMSTFGPSFWSNATKVNWPVAQEPEGEATDVSLNFQTMGWGEGTPYHNPPVVDRYRWLEPKFMMNICDRWNQHKGKLPLQTAFFNGAGLETWENVWSCWVGLTQGDGEAIRRGREMIGFFGQKGFLASAEWEPHVATVHQDIFFSKFPFNATEVLWLGVNLDDSDANGQIIEVSVPAGAQLYDCYHGKPAQTSPLKFQSHLRTNCYAGHGADDLEVPTGSSCGNMSLSDCQQRCTDTAKCTAVVWDINTHSCYRRANVQLEKCEGNLKFNTYTAAPEGTVAVDLEVEGNGLACLVATAHSSGEFQDFLAKMNKLTGKPLQCFDWTFGPLLQTMVEIEATKAYTSAPKGMVSIPAVNSWEFATAGLEIETTYGCDLQFPWESMPGTNHRKVMDIAAFYMDVYPVTNQDYAQYLSATGYTPRDTTRWLNNWNGARQPPQGLEKKPVTYLSLAEARAYCNWQGKRLPHAWEWQYAAQGEDSTRIYPWGNDGWHAPKTQVGNTCAGPEDVDAHAPAGCSPFGVCDLVGNVWQLTDEFRDDHSRMVLVKGGSNYQPARFESAQWYFKSAFQLPQHNRFTLMSESYDRAATVGFRCAADPPASPTPPPCSASLCGSLAPLTAREDLTSVGAFDWVHMGLGTDRKVVDGKAANLISDVSVINGGSATDFSGTSQLFFWNDGSGPPANKCHATGITTGVATGIYVDGKKNGFAVSTAANGAEQELKVYVGVFDSTATVTAQLSDKSSAPFTASLTAENGSQETVVTLKFKAAVGTKLSVTWENDGDSGNVTFQAAALSGPSVK